MISAEVRRRDADELALSLLSGAAGCSVGAEYFTRLVLALYRLDDHLSGRTSVEIGCWMGGSTCCLAEGLKTGGAFLSRRLFAFDSFVWRPWMATHAWRERMDISALSPGSSFLDRFLEECSAHRGLVHPVVVEFGDDAPRCMPGEGRDVELFVYDMGPDRDMLEDVWQRFSPGFLPGVTHVVFHEYAKLRSPDLWRFCAERSDELRPLHKPVGSAQGFLFDPDRLRGKLR